MILLALLAPQALAAPADCPRMFDSTEIVDAAGLAETAFMKLDTGAFTAARVNMEDRVRCSSELLSPAIDARIERVEALGAFLDGRTAQVSQALAGLFAAEPGHQIASSLLPDGHPIRTLIKPAMLLMRDDPGLELPVPSSGWIEVDGQHALKAPTQRAAVLQQIDGEGAVVATHFRWPDEVGFTWVVPVAASLKPVTAGKGPGRGPKLAVPALVKPAPSPWVHRAPLLGGAVASLATSGALFAMAAQEKGTFTDSPILGADATVDQRSAYRAELDAMKAKANGETYASWAAGGVGLALGVVAVITW